MLLSFPFHNKPINSIKTGGTPNVPHLFFRRTARDIARLLLIERSFGKWGNGSGHTIHADDRLKAPETEDNKHETIFITSHRPDHRSHFSLERSVPSGGTSSLQGKERARRATPRSGWLFGLPPPPLAFRLRPPRESKLESRIHDRSMVS